MVMLGKLPYVSRVPLNMLKNQKRYFFTGMVSSIIFFLQYTFHTSPENKGYYKDKYLPFVADRIAIGQNSNANTLGALTGHSNEFKTGN